MNLPEKCNGCATNKTFTLQHELQCKVGELVTGNNKKVHDSFVLMATQAFTYYYVRDKQIISSIWYITGL